MATSAAGSPRSGADPGFDETLFELANVAIWLGDLHAVKRRVDAWRARGVADVRAHLAGAPGELADVVAEMRMLGCNACAVELVEGTDVPTTLARYPELFLPESYDALCVELQGILDQRERMEFEAPIRTLCDTRRHVRIGVRFPAEPAGWRRVVVTMLDVTASRRVEQALRDSEERFRLATRAVHRHIYDVQLP